MEKLWYKNTVIYSVEIENFLDSNKDGIGDFHGLKNRLGYLRSLGVNCIWILPFYASPNKDNGYDVMDYFKINPKYGDFGDFAEFVDAAEEHGIRILVDLVVNHTSNEHFWFQEARKDKNSKYRDYYIWSKTKPKENPEHIIFGKEQGNSNWKYDQKAKAYYYHTFYGFQPDLNLTNPKVQNEIIRIMHFWLKLGISGFRIDAAEHMVREKGGENFESDPHVFLRKMRDFVEKQRKDAVLLAEVDVDPKNYKSFFGDEDQMHLLFNFYLTNNIWLAFARNDPKPIVRALNKLPEIKEKEQLVNFGRNHDELDLGQLTDKEREDVFKVFAPEENMQIYGRGIRRRLASMLSNDKKRIKLMYSLIFTLPGSPKIRYGDEIGMGEDLNLEERESVRTIMQWSNSKNAGFSDAPKKKVNKLISKGEYGYKKVNVNDQQRDPNSLLTWMRMAINFRLETPEFGNGDFSIIKTDQPNILAYCRKLDDGIAIAVHNFSDKKLEVVLELDDTKEIVDVFGDKNYKNFDPKTKKVEISGYGYRWMRRRNVVL